MKTNMNIPKAGKGMGEGGGGGPQYLKWNPKFMRIIFPQNLPIYLNKTKPSGLIDIFGSR